MSRRQSDTSHRRQPSARSADPDTVVEALLRLLSAATGGSAVLVVAPEGGMLRPLCIHDPHPHPDPVTPAHRWPPDDPAWPGAGALTIRLPGAATLVVIPSSSGPGLLADAVALAEQTVAALVTIDSVCHDLREARDEAAALAVEALTDPLTGLANRRALHRRLADSHHAGGTVAVIDIDGLKKHNDRYGHEAGDTMLRRAALALRSAATPDEMVARIGGDEFVVLSAVTGVEAAQDLQRRIVQSLAEHRVPASVGLSSPRPQSVIEAWAEADSQMYHAKRGRQPSELPGAAPPGHALAGSLTGR